MRLALVTLNPVVGDIAGNSRAIEGWIARAREAGAQLVVFPELSLVGYPPRDLLLQEGFQEEVEAEARRLASRATMGEIVAVVGAPWRRERGGGLMNSLLVLRDGGIGPRYDKRLLPTYDVFDEERYFKAGASGLVIEVGGDRVGLSVCEDLWQGADTRESGGWWGGGRYEDREDPVADLVRMGAQLIVNPSASPFCLGKDARQREVVSRHVVRHGVAIATVNQVGGNDDLIFDGHTAVYGPVIGAKGVVEARLVAAGPIFRAGMTIVETPSGGEGWGGRIAVADPVVEATREGLLWEALVLGTRDYCRKTGFGRCVLGLSGGIDSAVTVCVAAAALGAERTLGVALPSRYSSPGSVADARLLARALGVRLVEVPIEDSHAAMERTLRPVFAELGAEPGAGLTEENVQSRLRGVILMALSNKTGAILLTTGNKSELAVGYCTLYGDMNGGLAVLSDVTKQDVYALARWINANHERAGFAAAPIPESSITKAPSAELRPNQTDQDTLPAYEALDEIVERYVEGRQSPARIVRESGLSEEVVRRVVRMIDVSEYKRKQTPVGLKVTGLTFGPGRRRPIAQGYRG